MALKDQNFDDPEDRLSTLAVLCREIMKNIKSAESTVAAAQKLLFGDISDISVRTLQLPEQVAQALDLLSGSVRYLSQAGDGYDQAHQDLLKINRDFAIALGTTAEFAVERNPRLKKAVMVDSILPTAINQGIDALRRTASGARMSYPFKQNDFDTIIGKLDALSI